MTKVWMTCPHGGRWDAEAAPPEHGHEVLRLKLPEGPPHLCPCGEPLSNKKLVLHLYTEGGGGGGNADHAFVASGGSGGAWTP